MISTNPAESRHVWGRWDSGTVGQWILTPEASPGFYDEKKLTSPLENTEFRENDTVRCCVSKNTDFSKF